MANLRETSVWEAGIYQLETSDPVMGGENGIDNRAPRQLANRTLWLKNELARQIELINNTKLAKTENAVSASKLATARNISMVGDGVWNVNFDGTQNATGALTLANSGVTAGSYNSVTVDAKGRVTRGLTQTHGLVTATTATGTANTATTNSNTFLNIVASGVGRTASVGSSTQITGTNGITVSSDTAGKLIVARDSNSPTATKLQTARTINGVAFDGTQNITIYDNTKAPAVHRHNWSEIDGKPAIITHPTQITSGDLDDYKEIGVYYCHTNVHAQDIANTPSNRAFALEVVRAAGVVQIFREYETAIVYMRAFYNKWSPWKRLATTEDNAPTATKLATARTLAITGDGTGQANFDGSANANIALTLANSGVTAGSYNSVTVDAKGRVTRGLTQTHGLVTATTATGTANTATTNSNTFLNIVASGVGRTASVGSSTQITGTNGITVSSDTAGKLIVARDSNSPTATKLQTARTINGVAFDGTQNITIYDNTKAPAVHRHNWSEIDGKPAIITHPTQITSGDLDDYKEIGVYYCHTNVHAQDIANTPSNRAFALEVVRAAGVVQIFREYETAIVYMRAFYNKWSPWKRLATTEDNAPTATKLATARTLAITGDGTGQANFDGSANANIALTLANSGVTAGSYNSVTVDAKGRVTRGLTQTHGLVTATTATGTANTATTNSNTFLNIVASGVGRTASVGSSTQITGTNGITVSSDTAGKLIVARDSNSPTATKLQTPRSISLTGAVTGSVNFDGSGNVSLATALKGIDRREYTGTLTPSHNSFKSQKVPITGSVEVLPNGRMVQYFTFVCPVLYFHKHGLSAFYREKLGVSSFTAEDSPHLELPLWTPMPHKIQEARIHLSANLNHNAWGEAQEWVYDWDAIFNHHANIKDKAYFAFRRWAGNQDEPVTFTIVVEGY